MNPPSALQSAARRSFPHEWPVVAIVGRPNVGKSTLFNRLVGGRRAIVDDLPGVTRDRNYAEAEWAGRRYWLVDTGGLDSEAGGALLENVQSQSRQAVDEADLVIFLFDGKSGLNPLDREAVDRLRKANKPVFFAVNKIDSRQRADNLYEFYALGIESLYPISAEHGAGVGELLDEVMRRLPAEPAAREAAPGKSDAGEAQAGEPLRIAVVGRPNVGKSTLVNRLVGFERSVVTRPRERRGIPWTHPSNCSANRVFWSIPQVFGAKRASTTELSGLASANR